MNTSSIKSSHSEKKGDSRRGRDQTVIFNNGKRDKTPHVSGRGEDEPATRRGPEEEAQQSPCHENSEKDHETIGETPTGNTNERGFRGIIK